MAKSDPPTQAAAATDDPRDDPQLVRDANAGDVTAFNALYHRYHPWVLGLAMRITHDRDLAQDVMQDVFLYLMSKFPGFGSDAETRPFRLTAKMTTFLYPVVKHLAIAARDKRKRLLLHSDAGNPDAQPPDPAGPATDDPAAGADADHQRRELAQVMAGLSDAHREVVLLRFVDGLTLQEIAAAMKVPLGTIKSRLHHALASLRKDPRTKVYFLDA